MTEFRNYKTRFGLVGHRKATFTINYRWPAPVGANFVVATDGFEIEAVVISAGAKPGILATRSVGKRRFAVFPALSSNSEVGFNSSCK